MVREWSERGGIESEQSGHAEVLTGAGVEREWWDRERAEWPCGGLDWCVLRSSLLLAPEFVGIRST